MADFVMPALGADMETGKVVQWLVEPGAQVHAGDVVAVVETHKGAIDVEIFVDGVIEDLAPLGADLPVGARLARVREVAQASEAAVPRAAAPPAVAPPTAAPTAAVPTAAVPIAAVPAAAVPVAAGPVAAGPVVATPPAAAAGAGSAEQARHAAACVPAGAAERLRISPAARRRAAAAGLDPATLRMATGDRALALADVEHALAARVSTTPAVVARSGAAFDAALMRQAIAAAMSRSKREIPHYYLGTTVDFGAAAAWVATYNLDRDPAERLLPAVLLLKAVALGLRQVPQLNGVHEDGRFRAAAGLHIGWAVSLRGGGLVAPALHHVDRQGPGELMAALRDLVQRARSGGLRSSELTDPTITVTSLGDRGADQVLGVIVPPQVALVGFGRVVVRPWVVDERVVPRPVVQLSLAADHRVSDGHLGGLFLHAVEQALQQPEALWHAPRGDSP